MILALKIAAIGGLVIALPIGAVALRSNKDVLPSTAPQPRVVDLFGEFEKEQTADAGKRVLFIRRSPVIAVRHRL